MNKPLIVLAAAGLSLVAVVGTANGQVPPPPSPPGSGATATPPPTATSTPLPTATATPVPATISLKLAHSKVRAGQGQGATVTTEAGATVKLTVTFPNGQHDVISGSAPASGKFTYSFVQPGGVTHGGNRTVSVHAAIAFNAQSKGSTKKYTIG